MSTVEIEKQDVKERLEEEERQKRIEVMPSVEECFNLLDFEAVARGVMKRNAWAYYSTGADDEMVNLFLLQYLLI